MTETDIAAEKRRLRAEAAQRRAGAHAEQGAAPAAALAHLREALGPGPGVCALYIAIRDEVDPVPTAGALLDADWALCAPVVEGAAMPLSFRIWTPDAPMEKGAFGTRHPAEPVSARPTALIAPLLAFDRRGTRLGYGGGHYDRTLEALRRDGPALLIGFAYAAQEVEALPCEPTDIPLDLIVTEAEIITPGAS